MEDWTYRHMNKLACGLSTFQHALGEVLMNEYLDAQEKSESEISKL
jgi:hypothetical protein